MNRYYAKGGKTKTKKSKSRVNEAGNYTKPSMRKRLFNKIKSGGKGGLLVKHKCLLNNTKKLAAGTKTND